ncbi:MAG TPA: hypothetical protein VGZ48_14640 [Candidatus Acidoferrales bacterium]|jgi:hypothetical protein|nr:hypothetical protein [Candidatus Acidoferrales bacterium]
MWKKIIAGAAVVIVIAGIVWLERRNRVVFNAVLEINLGAKAVAQKKGTGGQPDATPVVELGAADVRDMELGIDAARDDQRVIAVLVRIGKVDADATGLKEIAAHIKMFRKSGKPSVCVLDEENAGNPANAIAVGCDKRIGEGPDAEDAITEFFDGKLGDDNWSRIDLRPYLKQLRDGAKNEKP